MEFLEFTLIDYPEALACSLYLPGCPLRCPYCQNWALQEFRPLDWNFFENELIPKIRARRGMLEAFVLSGGEPSSLGASVSKILQRLRSEFPNLKLGLHSAGYNPGIVLEQFRTGCLDWLGLDVKAPLLSVSSHHLYRQLSGSAELAQSVLNLLRQLRDLWATGASTKSACVEIRLTLEPSVWVKEAVLAELRSLVAVGFVPENGFHIALQRVQLTEKYPGDREGEQAAALQAAASALFAPKALELYRGSYPDLIVRD